MYPRGGGGRAGGGGNFGRGRRRGWQRQRGGPEGLLYLRRKARGAPGRSRRHKRCPRELPTLPTRPREPPPTKTVCGLLLLFPTASMAAAATAFFARLLTGSGPILPTHSGRGQTRATAATTTAPTPTRDGVAGIRMPASFTDHCLHYMETGRGAPLVAVTVRRAATA